MALKENRCVTAVMYLVKYIAVHCRPKYYGKGYGSISEPKNYLLFCSNLCLTSMLMQSSKVNLRFVFGLIKVARDFASEIEPYPLLSSALKYLFWTGMIVVYLSI